MGFDAALYTCPKYKDIGYKDLKVIERLLDYENSQWIKDNYSSAEEYAKSEYKYYKEQPKEAIDFYRDHLIDSEFGNSKDVFRQYDYWCSNGSGEIYEYIQTLGEKADENSDATRILTRKDIVQLMMWCLNKIMEYMPQQCTISKGYRYVRDEDGSIDDDPDITLFKVDGFEIQFDEDQSVKRFDTNPEWECYAGFPKKYFDQWEFGGYEIGLKACAKILSEINDDDSWIIYNGGW